MSKIATELVRVGVRFLEPGHSCFESELDTGFNDASQKAGKRLWASDLEGLGYYQLDQESLGAVLNDTQQPMIYSLSDPQVVLLRPIVLLRFYPLWSEDWEEGGIILWSVANLGDYETFSSFFPALLEHALVLKTRLWDWAQDPEEPRPLFFYGQFQGEDDPDRAPRLRFQGTVDLNELQPQPPLKAILKPASEPALIPL